MIGPPPTPARRLVRQQRFQLRPLFLSQVMAIVHRDDLSHPTHKIQGTRPSRAEYRAREAREAAGVAQLPDVPLIRVGSWQVAGTGYRTTAEEIWAESIRAQRRHIPIRRPETADPDGEDEQPAAS